MNSRNALIATDLTAQRARRIIPSVAQFGGDWLRSANSGQCKLDPNEMHHHHHIEGAPENSS